MCRRFFGFWCRRGSDTQTLLTSLEQDASSYEEGSLSDFDLLPDEVMLHIFSFLTHGGPLLDAVPLVCRHLRHLNLHLSAPGDDRTSNMAALLGWMQPRRCDAFQVIADLPRLRELHLSFPKERPLEYNGALRGCARGLRVLTVDRWLESPAASDDLLGDLLHGAAASLRHLRVWHKSGRGDILEKVVKCSELERLSLLGCNGVGLAELRRLRSLSSLRLSVFSPDVATALNHLADVRRVCFDELPRLQRLWVSFGWKHLKTESLADMLADCAADFKECRPDVDGKWDLL
ncbi:uncharacterized protein LOC117649207 [Thrips palmi]|uniref:Uncharacterized protein LOC117649207 n=1 Tax=Thrips palmi TaxID=161013 RepID=A0A6P8ZDJ6_THRPL|nr:uncharacterized protein LOC117649207 [Thrips palmi]